MTVQFLTGDCREVLKTLARESVDCVVTSPPYFGLRDYGTAQWEGGDPSCDHARFLGGHGDASPKQVTSTGTQKYQYREECAKCGARRTDAQCGVEPTPDAFVANLVDVFREVRRVLHADGTLWLNLGDSYWSNPGNGRGGGSTLAGGKPHLSGTLRVSASGSATLKPKDLVGIPWAVAFALRADGWWLRQDVIWAKPNPMPESVTDRCTKSHEHLFLFSKSATYHFDAAAIAEPAVHAGRVVEYDGDQKNVTAALDPKMATRVAHTVTVKATRNRRDVWTITTKPFAEAHFATFPPDLVEPCVLAGCPEGGTVLDPFAGAGTVGLVADRLDRDAVLIELNPLYVEMAQRRLVADRERRASIQPALTLSDL